MNPLSIAVKGKGFLGTVKRANTIWRQYGVSPSKMELLLERFISILDQFDCGATFPITVAPLANRNGFARRFQARNIEFAVHGYYHIDHSKLSRREQYIHLNQALRVLSKHGVLCTGFRCPYLRWNEDTLEAARHAGFLYDSSQGLGWDVVDEVKTEDYERVLDFYGAISVKEYPALPYLDNGLLRLPYCLPDDEALVERFHLRTAESMGRIWLAILEESYHLGELFTLGLHPERIGHCEAALMMTLRKARELSPPVWIACLGEIARWWKARSESRITLHQMDQDEYELSVDGPEGVSILSRGVEILTPTVTWDGNYQLNLGPVVRFRTTQRPFIGVSPSSSPQLKSFIRQQGYLVESAENDQNYGLFFHRPRFERKDERPLLAEIEHRNFPIVRLGRWPNGSRSAMSITGDIDALTIWDYTTRFLSRYG